jgi:hypothetical protein
MQSTLDLYVSVCTRGFEQTHKWDMSTGSRSTAIAFATHAANALLSVVDMFDTRDAICRCRCVALILSHGAGIPRSTPDVPVLPYAIRSVLKGIV